MKPDEKAENLIRESGMEARQEWLEQTKADTLNAFEQAQDSKSPAEGIWRTIMKNRMTQIAALLAVAAGIIGLTLLKRPVVQEAYAIEQTIAAMDTIRTVYFKAEFFKQGDVECWMQFDDPGQKPSHVCLFMSGVPYRKIDSPQGSFGYNIATNRYRQNSRDERRMNWYPDFADFFKQSLKAAKQGAMEISSRPDPATGKEMIAVSVQETNRKAEYLIDPETKLPVRFITLEVSDFMHYFRQTIAVRNMSEIVYNQIPPAGIFEIPDDAEEVTNEHDVFVRPDIGMPVGGLTAQQACEKIVREVAAAMNQRDWQGVSKLMFPFGPPLKEMEARLPADLSIPLVEILEAGKPYEKDGYWYIPSKSREYGGRVKEEQVPVKFYEFDGKRYCMIMWPD